MARGVAIGIVLWLMVVGLSMWDVEHVGGMDGVRAKFGNHHTGGSTCDDFCKSSQSSVVFFHTKLVMDFINRFLQTCVVFPR